jgi:DNA-binding CsgD family transcriptional regulator
MLRGRHVERARLDRLLADARVQRSSALVIRGAPGVGKSVLLDYAADHAGGLRVLRSCGTESEVELPFAALHQLLYPMRDRLDMLPGPQAAALRAALGLGQPQDLDRFLVAAGVLTFLGELATEPGLLCLVDDVQWLDGPSADVLIFSARRLQADGVALVFALRETGPDVESRFLAAGLTELRVSGLDSDAARALLADRWSNLDPTVRDRIIAEAAGNPLALTELPTLLTEAQLGGDEPLPQPLPIGAGVRGLYARRLHLLSPDARRLIEIAAADDTGSPATLLAAGLDDGLDDGLGALAELERSGLVEVRGGRIGFRHPLVRSTAYAEAGFAGRQRAHLALAAVLDEAAQPDRWAWHRAAATVGTDADVALALAHTADRAAARGGPAVAGHALERSAELTPPGPERGRRFVASASAFWAAGAPPRALRLLNRAEPELAGGPDRAHMLHLRGLIELRCGMPEVAYEILLDAATQASSDDPGTALSALVLASEAASFNGDAARVVSVGERAARVPAATGTDRLMVNMLTGTGGIFGGRWAEGAAALRAVVAAGESMQDPTMLLWAGRAALYLGDQPTSRTLHVRAVELARRSGALGMLCTALDRLSFSDLLLGRPAEAAASADEGLRLAAQIGQVETAIYYGSLLAWTFAVRGEEAACRAHTEQALALAAARNIKLVAALCWWSLGLLDLGLGRPEQALSHLRRVGHPAIRLWSTPDLVEASVRCRQSEPAAAPLAAFSQWGEQTEAHWALAATARCRGLLAEPAAATGHYEEAVRRATDAGPRPFDEARTQLLYGEALRRLKHRGRSREQLRAALETFEHLGATPWAERARAELRASGETARRRDETALTELTPQELQIARLASQGVSNPEIAAAVFLSRRTVEYHLHKVFTKLGITSRMQLMRLDLT